MFTVLVLVNIKSFGIEDKIKKYCHIIRVMYIFCIIVLPCLILGSLGSLVYKPRIRQGKNYSLLNNYSNPEN